MQTSSRAVIYVLCVSGLAFAMPNQAYVRAEAPNIILILADDVGLEPLGCYGGTSFPTPNIDRLATSGMRFQHCYSMPVCHPTRVCLLTGQYPQRLKQPRWGTFPRSAETDSLAQRMKRAGYATAVGGKWQLTLLRDDLQQPYRLGFDEYCLFGWHEGARFHDPLIWQNGKRRGDTAGQFGPDLYIEFLTNFMERNRDRPFFTFYSMALCHDVTDDLERPVPYAPGKDRYLTYEEMIRAMDDCVGRVVTAVSELGLSEKTLIVFTGDNGTAKRSIIRATRSTEEPERWIYERDQVFCEFNGRQVAGGKGNLDDTGTRVPLIASWPGTIPANQVVDDLVDFSDFLPTFADLAGAPIPVRSNLDGVSHAGRLKGEDSNARSWAYSESKDRFWVRTQRFKLTNEGKLFDLQNDPRESKPLRIAELDKNAKRVRAQLQEAIDLFPAATE